MVSSNGLFALATAFAGVIPAVLAESLAEAAQKPDILVYNPSEKRASPKKTTVDPYAGWACAPWYPLEPIPPKPQCAPNNCYRYVLGRWIVATGLKDVC
jgi:hypothetical protein